MPGLCVGIAFRSGAGRNEDAISSRDGIALESMWSEQAAQDAWASMLRHTAERYRSTPDGRPARGAWELRVPAGVHRMTAAVRRRVCHLGTADCSEALEGGLGSGEVWTRDAYCGRR